LEYESWLHATICSKRNLTKTKFGGGGYNSKYSKGQISAFPLLDRKYLWLAVPRFEEGIYGLQGKMALK
jgi:hypothetical protein